MEENNKVVVFEKKEIVLVLIFVLVLIITSFTLGIRLGKKLSLTEAGIKDEDVKTVELKSAVEEDVEATVAEDAKLTDEEKLKKLMEESKGRLNDELEKFSKDETQTVDPLASAAPEEKSPMAGKFT